MLSDSFRDGFNLLAFQIIAGVISATRQYGWADKIITFSVLIGISVPSFFLGMMILYFAVQLRWFPAKDVYLVWWRWPN